MKKRLICALLMFMLVLGVSTFAFAEQADLNATLDSAAAGTQIDLSSDIAVKSVSVPEGVTLNLNGHTLEANYVSCFGNIIDSTGNGLLKVPGNHFLIQQNNIQLPVKDSGGYRFFALHGFNAQCIGDTNVFAFQPLFTASSHRFLNGGSEKTGITVNVRVTWKTEDGTPYQYFVYKDSLLNAFLSSYNADTGKFGRMFTLTLVSPEKYEDITLEAIVLSETGVELAAPAVGIGDSIETPVEPEPVIVKTRTVQLLPEVKTALPQGALASAPGVQFSGSPYAYTNTSLFAGKHITRIGIPVKSVKALDDRQTFTLSLVKTTSNTYQYVSQTVLTLPKEQLGSSTTVNKWIYVDVDLQLGTDETLAFGAPTDTVQWGYSTTNNSIYNFRSAPGSWTSVIKESILFDITATETLEFKETQHGLAAVTNARVFPNVLADFPESAIAGGNPVEYTSPPYSYVDQTLFADSRITKIGIPVQSVQALDDEQFFTLSVIKTGSGAYQYVKQYKLTLPRQSSTTVNKWIYFDVDITLGADETLAFGGKTDSVSWAWKRNFNNSRYEFRDANGGKTKGIFFDIYKQTVLTYEEYEKQLQAEQDQLEAELAQVQKDAELRALVEGKGISILGDSISTFTGWSNNTGHNATIGSNAVYYNGSTDGFSAVSETWWMQTLSRTGLELVVNNSWSGDCVSARGVDRAQQLHNNDGKTPDIIAVYLGINDFRTKVTAETFEAKYEEMLSGLLRTYDKADVYLFTLLYTTNVNSGVNPADVVTFNAIIEKLAQQYDCTLVDLYNDTGITAANLSTYMGDGKLHPNYAGMDLITECFLEALRKNYTQPKPLISTDEFTYGSYFDHDRFQGNTGTRLTSGDYGKIRAADALLPAQDITVQVSDTNLTDYKVTLGFYNKDGVYTGRTGILPMTDGQLTIKASSMSGAYFRVNVYLYNGKFTKVPESAIIEVYGGEQQKPPVVPEEPEQPGASTDLKITILGDSISTGGYVNTLGNLTGATIQNLSVSGKLLAGGLTGMVEGIDRDADVIIIFGGTNDYWHKTVTIGDANSTDSKTYVGALKYILNYLKTNHPDAQYLFVFPPDQTFGGNPSSTDFGKGTLDDFRAAFLTFCQANDVSYVNLADTEFDPAKHSGDGVHPNAAGHQIIADAIYQAIS